MARQTWAVTGALAVCGVLVALSGVTAATTVVRFIVDDSYPPVLPGGVAGPGVRSDGNSEYFDYRIDPNHPLNWCVDAAPFSQGNLFVRLNRKLDGEAGVLRCNENLDSGGVNNGIPRNVTLTIGNDAVCDLLADPSTSLTVTDSANVDWNVSSSTGPCTLAENDNPRIRLATLYKARAKTTTVDFLTYMLNSTVSYEIRSDAPADIEVGLAPNQKVVTYAGTYHLVQFATGSRAKTVGPAFTMPVKMTFETSVVP